MYTIRILYTAKRACVMAHKSREWRKTRLGKFKLPMDCAPQTRHFGPLTARLLYIYRELHLRLLARLLTVHLLLPIFFFSFFFFFFFSGRLEWIHFSGKRAILSRCRLFLPTRCYSSEKVRSGHEVWAKICFFEISSFWN